jgi:nucleoside-diphosphate-sugar epimerase
MKSKRILVTGGAGFVGTRLVSLLLKEGFFVRVLDNFIYNQVVFLDILDNSNFELIKGDLRNEDIVRKSLEDIDLIVHMAAIVGAPKCDKDPQLAIEVNLQAAKNLDKLRKSIPIIYISTGSVYGKLDEICTEESPVNPFTIYSKTKYDFEKVVKESGNFIIFRPATAFGVSSRMRTDLLINDLTFMAIKKGKIVLFEPSARRTFIHVLDFARAIAHAINHFDSMKNNIYNIGDEKMNLTKKHVAELIKKHVDYELELSEEGEDPDKRDYEVSYEKFKNTSFRTTISVEDGIISLLKCYQIIEDRNFSNRD